MNRQPVSLGPSSGHWVWVACSRVWGVISDGKDSEDSSNTTRGTVDDEEGDMRRRGARECEEALMEATEARRGYARVAAWDEGNLIQAMARLKNPTIAPQSYTQCYTQCYTRLVV
jgi:hypothetical protein